MRQRSRDRYLSVLWSPAGVRPALFALHGLDLELQSVVAGTTEAMIGEIRLAWWREALEGLDAGRVPAQPLLEAAAAELLPRGVSGAMLAGIEDRWLCLIGADDVPAAHVAGGAALFGMAARLLGGEVALGEELGTAWVLREGRSGKVPATLHSLLALVRLAARRADDPPGSLARQWLLFRTVALGL